MHLILRRALTASVATAAAALTIGGLAWTPAQADPVAPPSLTCAADTGSQQRTINCTVTASGENLHFVRVNNVTLGQTFVVSTKLPCSSGGLGGAANLNFRAPEGNKYKVTVVDCAGNKYVYKIDKNGNVIAPAPQGSLVVTQTETDSAGNCYLAITGTGLQPGSTITFATIPAGYPPSFNIGTVNPDGTFLLSPMEVAAGYESDATGIAANGTAITSNIFPCPVAV